VRECPNVALWNRLATAFVATALCQAVQMIFLPWDGVRPSLPFFWAHFLFVLAFQIAVALVAGGRRGERPWAAIVFVTPVALSLGSGQLFHSLPRPWLLAVVAIGSLVFCAIAWIGREPLSPWLAAVLGATLGAEILRFRADAFHGAATPLAAYARPAAILLGVILAYGLGRRLPDRCRWPPVRAAVLLTVLGLALALVARMADPWRASLAASAARHGTEPPPIVLIVLDTVRADHLRAYGYGRDTMPRLEAFGRDYCLRAERAIAVHPSSLETHASLLTGLYPPHHGAHRRRLQDHAPSERYAYPLPASHATLPAVLGRAGYWPVALSANYGQLDPEFGLSRGFDVYRASPEDLRRRTPWHAPFEATGLALESRLVHVLPASWGAFISYEPYREARVITDEALTAVDAAGDHSFFLFLNYLDAHGPNAPPAPFLDAFPGRDAGSDIDGSYESIRPYLGVGKGPAANERRHLEALYDAELRYLDSELGRLLDHLRRHPRWEEMQIFVTADHGESLGDRGLVGHGHVLYDEQVSVPFFFKPGRVSTGLDVPGVLRGGVVQSVDLFPLVLQQAGLPVPAGLDSEALEPGRTEARAWSYCAREHAGPDPRFERELRSIEVGRLKLVASSRGELELYDIAADPREEHDLSAERPSQVETLLERLGPAQPFVPRGPEEGIGADARDRLRSLGYIQ
jgi:arylsulfatase A-like enzyme